MIIRRARRKVSREGKEKVDSIDENLSLNNEGLVDWTKLPEDLVIHLFSSLNHRDRASLSSTCTAFFALSKSPCLWMDLDLRAHKCKAVSIAYLAPRCQNLQKLSFNRSSSLHAIINLRAENVREIIGEGSSRLTDAQLSMLVARHESLERLVIGPHFSDKISSDAIKTIAFCCPKLQKLYLSDINEVNASAIDALTKHCKRLTDIGFVDCKKVDEAALGEFESVRFLSVAGSTIDWNKVLLQWNKLSNLIALDVSRTNINSLFVLSIFSTFSRLKVLCALSFPLLEDDANFVSKKNHKGKVLLSIFTDIMKGIENLLGVIPSNDRKKDKKVNEMLDWVELTISSSLHRISEVNRAGLTNFWLNQGPNLLLTFMQSSKEELLERAVTIAANFVGCNDENVNNGRAERFTRDGGIALLLKLGRSRSEVLQATVCRAIANISVNVKAVKATLENGGISILIDVTKSWNRKVSEEAAGGLWSLSHLEEHKSAIAEAGGVEALLDLILKWLTSDRGEGILEHSVEALENLAADYKCSTVIASHGGVRALLMLATHCRIERLQNKATRALKKLATHGQVGALEALMQLTRSPQDGVRQEANGALQNLSFYEKNGEAIEAAGGMAKLVQHLY